MHYGHNKMQVSITQFLRTVATVHKSAQKTTYTTTIVTAPLLAIEDEGKLKASL